MANYEHTQPELTPDAAAELWHILSRTGQEPVSNNGNVNPSVARPDGQTLFEPGLDGDDPSQN